MSQRELTRKISMAGGFANSEEGTSLYLGIATSLLDIQGETKTGLGSYLSLIPRPSSRRLTQKQNKREEGLVQVITE